MTKWLYLAAILLLPVKAGAQAETLPSPGSIPNPIMYDQSEDGFRSQFDAAFQAYRAGNSALGHQLLDGFRLPHADEWFSEHLGTDQRAKLTERYERLFANFSESLENTVKDVGGESGWDIATNLEEGKGEKPTSNRRPGSKMSGVVSVKEPRLFFCHFAITVAKKESQSWANTFTHEDGAFRFIGFGGWPFWVWEDGTEGGAPKGGWVSRPPILISQVPPVYPKAARAEGVVSVRIMIDKEGRVTKVDVLEGDPLLAQAAVDAVKQWRYKPGTLGGTPAASLATANVVFRLH